MKRWTKFLMGSLVVASALFNASSVLPQGQQGEEAPKPAARAYSPLIEGTGDQQTNDNLDQTVNLHPDDRPLTGVQGFSLGTPEVRHSYWVPGFQYGNFARSTAQSQPGATDWNTTSYFAANASLLEAWTHAQLTVNYSGGGYVSTDSTQGNGYYQQLAFAQTFEWRRWQLEFLDQFAYLPQSQFGFGGTTNISIPGVGGSLGAAQPGMQPNYVPNQTIFTASGSRYSDSFATQAVYALSPRGSITLVGSIGILRFSEAGNIQSNDGIFSGGYNYALTPRDTLGVQYRFSGYRYIGSPQALDDHVVQLAYGRKITGRLALQLYGGPEVTNFQVPLAGVSSRISGSGGVTLICASARSTATLSYIHGVSGGSGVFTGSSSDLLQGSVGRQLTREWHGSINFGYARNSALAGNAQQNAQTYDSWYAGAGLDRPLGRDATFSIGYTAYIQNSAMPVCVTGTCGASFVQHQVSVSFQWHSRPLVLR
jgi:hypothetical protein